VGRSPELPPVTPDIFIAARAIVTERAARENARESQGAGGLAPARCSRCGVDLLPTGRLAKQALAAGLCSDCWLQSPSQAVKDLVAAAYRVLTNRNFSGCAGNASDPESSALQALLDGIDAVERRSPRHVVQCRACDSAPHNGLKHGTGSSLGSVGEPCHVPGCRCPGYQPCHLETA
jgi:hypothetical protein